MMSIFSSCLRVQALSDSVKLSRRLIQKIGNFGSFKLWFNTLYWSELPSMVWMIEIELLMRVSNSCNLRIGRDMCTIVIMHTIVYISLSTLIFENFRGARLLAPSKSASASPFQFVAAVWACSLCPNFTKHGFTKQFNFVGFFANELSINYHI